MSTGDERPSRWVPMKDIDVIDAAHLGKLGEECAELSGIINRIWIQGIDEADPESGELNYDSLWKEIADVQAMCDLVTRRFRLPLDQIKERVVKKRNMKLHWHTMLNSEPGVRPLIRFRGHRGGLAESMVTQVGVSSRHDLIAYLKQTLPMLDLIHRIDELKCELYGGDRPDGRIDWPETWIVTIPGSGPIGFTDAPLPE